MEVSIKPPQPRANREDWPTLIVTAQSPATAVAFFHQALSMGSPISCETFLARARARFGDAYDYSGIVYKSFKTPIGIHCRLHPVKLISITPEKHLQTTGGCKFCLRQNRIRMLERELLREAFDHPQPEPAATTIEVLHQGARPHNP